MQKRSLLPAALALGAALWLAVGCTPLPPPANGTSPSNPRTPAGPSAAGDVPASGEMADTKPVRDAVTSAIKLHATLFPKGTRLNSVSVQGGVAVLDFGPEFSQLANMGDSTEASAQKQLRAALAEFSAIQKMRVTVRGKPFDSQATDWTTPFPVRDTNVESGAGGRAPVGSGQPSKSGGG